MKEREKEVKESLESSLRERDKERDQHKKDEAVQTFKALLADLVRITFKQIVHEELLHLHLLSHYEAFGMWLHCWSQFCLVL